MALTRSFLKALGIEEEKIGEIIIAHSETVSGLKADIDKYKADAEKLPTVQKQLSETQEALKTAEKEDYKGKYESEKAAHQKLIEETAAEKTRVAKENAMREALKAAGYSDKGISKIIKFGGLSDSVKLDDNNKMTNTDDFVKAADSEWSEYKGESKPASAAPATPPEDNGSKPADAQAAHAAELAAKFHRERYGENPKPEKEG